MRNKSAIVGTAFVLPSLLGVLAFYVLPLASGVASSLGVGGGAAHAGLRNFAELLRSSAFRLAMANTGGFLLVGAALLLASALALMLLLDGAFRRRRLASTALAAGLIPMLLPTGAVLLFFTLFLADGGLLDQGLRLLGLRGVSFLRGDAFFALLLLLLWKNVGYSALVLFAGLRGLDPSQMEAARVDGAGFWRCLFRIQLPYLRPFLSFCLLMAIVAVFRNYRESYLFFGYQPPDSAYMILNFVTNNFANLNLPRLHATTTLLVAALAAVQGFVLFVGGKEHA